MSVRDVVQAAAGVGGGGEYVEDVFSTYLYTGNDSTQTITNGIDLDSEGGMVWVKSRDQAGNPTIIDTDRGVNKNLPTNQTYAEDSDPSISSFNSNGFSINSIYGFINDTGINYASWTFRKAPKFFDIVTWSGNDVSGREIAHDLGSTPGCIIVKKTNGAYNWQIYHNAVGATKFLEFNTLQAQTSSAVWNDTAPTDSVFTVGNEYGVNQSGSTYVAYLFAHDAGGFGDDGEQNVISCGSYTANSSGVSVDLGFEPQWIMVKVANNAGSWYLIDNMRGGSANDDTGVTLKADDSTDENTATEVGYITATGFNIDAANYQTNEGTYDYIYIAIRRGPMATPESGTEVFAINTFNAENVTLANQYAGFPIDLLFLAIRNGSALNVITRDRLRRGNYLSTSSTAVEGGSSDSYFDNMYGAKWPTSTTPDTNLLAWMFRRAPGFFDVVAYTGTGSATTVAHNLGVAPELIIAKRRSGAIAHWPVYSKSLNGGVNPAMYYIYLSMSDGTSESPSAWNDTAPTSSVFTVGYAGNINALGAPYVAYLFASLPGVSKVGSYTGTGADLNVDCGFSAGARFILIKRIDPASTGGWYVWDSLRGIVSGNDPYLLLNSSAAEEPNTDYIDPLSAGFTVTSSAPAALNASGGTYIFLAIA
jgi:hypothetical protein